MRQNILLWASDRRDRRLGQGLIFMLAILEIGMNAKPTAALTSSGNIQRIGIMVIYDQHALSRT
jgi:hypothetical protein